MNPIKKAYESFDNFMMYNTNNAVKAWNWTTGRTKSSLANLVLTTTAISFVLGESLDETSPAYIDPRGVGLSIVWLYVTHSHQKININRDEKEQVAVEQKLKDLEVAQTKEKDRNFWIPAWHTISILQALVSKYELSQGNPARGMRGLMTCVGFEGIAISKYIMRTDYLPPRKNCVSRGIDKLKETIAAYKTQPALPCLDYLTGLLK